MVQEALDRWWGPLMQMHGPRTTRPRTATSTGASRRRPASSCARSSCRHTCRGSGRSACSRPIRSCSLDEADRRVALHRARLARAAHGRHRPRPEVAGAARFPAPEPRRDGLGARHDPRAPPPRPDVPTGTPPEGRRDEPADWEGGPRPWEVFRRRRTATRCATPATSSRPTPSSPCTTRASSTAGARRASGCGSCRAQTSSTLRSRSAPAAARPLVQEAGRLRHARQARGGARGGPGQARSRRHAR